MGTEQHGLCHSSDPQGFGNLRGLGDILLVACYESGHPPLSLAWPLAFLKEAGYPAAALDAAVEAFPDEAAVRTTFVGISVPMPTALRLGAQVAARVRAVNPGAHICFFGLYAWLNADYLLSSLADSVVAGEDEAALVELIRVLVAGGDPGQVAGISTAQSRNEPRLARFAFPLPDRSALPSPEHYARYVHNGQSSLAGYVQASRGCRHTCRHCPIVPVYAGRFFVVPAETVLSDIRQQARGGARHITFGDPDFLKGPRHALQIARRLHAEFADLTFDFTTKVEHILEHRQLFAEFAALGCTFVVSAIESLSDRVLERLAKGHTAVAIDEALSILDAAGIALHPTLVAFTPWTTLDDYLAQLAWIRARGLANHVPPIQLAIRLLVPPRSALLASPDVDGWLGALDPEAFTYRWAHPDSRMDTLYQQAAARVEWAEQTGEARAQTHEAIRALAYAAAGRPIPTHPAPPARPLPPRLTEDWFC